MRKRVKICGLRTEADVDAALAAGADMVGFVFFPPSPRNLDPSDARPLLERARGRAETVALVVDPVPAALADLIGALRPDVVQFHGKEPPEAVSAVAARFPVRTMKAVGIAGAADLDTARHYAGAVDLLLLDAKAPESASRPGGLGRAFDWTLLADFDPGVPWLLSGGLSADNVGAALAATSAPGVDVSSGVEQTPGVKDPALIRRFAAAVREAETGIAA